MRSINSTIYKTAISFIALTCLSLPLQAEETAVTPVTRSISYLADTATDESTRAEALDQADAEVLDTLVTQGFRAESVPVGIIVETSTYDYSVDISIFDAATTLISDFDDDGFYHRFSVAIDADTIYDTSWVFARLYLSYEGGPWNYYASSDDFHIHGDSELDIQVIETELAEGFPAGYYDIRIELYDAGNGDLLYIYGPYDDDSLSALPLEDSIYDDDYYTTGIVTEVVVAGHGGLGVWTLLLVALATVLRKPLLTMRKS